MLFVGQGGHGNPTATHLDTAHLVEYLGEFFFIRMTLVLCPKQNIPAFFSLLGWVGGCGVVGGLVGVELNPQCGWYK